MKLKNEKSKILIKNATLLTFDSMEDESKADVFIDNGVIREIGPSITKPSAEVIDATNLVAMPGFVQTHVHLCQTLFRNQSKDEELLEWLYQRIWPLEAVHTYSSMAVSARLGILELIKTGTTTILDMGSVHHNDAILKEIADSGLRASVGVTFMDNGENVPARLLRPASESFAYFDDLYDKWHDVKDGRIHLNLAPRFALSCSEDVMCQIAEKASQRGLLIHTHASENRKETKTIQDRYELGNVAYYHKLGMTGQNLCLAHCIWLDDEETEILARTGTRVLHCPSSNLKLGSGIADIPRYLEKGIHCSLGADGAPCNNNLNMLMEMRLAGLIQKLRYGPQAIPARTLAEMATFRGTQAMHLDHQIGSLKVGKKADIILVNLNATNTVPGNERFEQLVYAVWPENIRTVIIDGMIVMKDRRMITIDEEDTINQAKEELKKLLNRVNSIRRGGIQ